MRLKMNISYQIGVKKVTIKYSDSESYYALVETDRLHKDISCNVEKWFGTSDYDKTKEKRRVGEKQKGDWINER